METCLNLSIENSFTVSNFLKIHNISDIKLTQEQFISEIIDNIEFQYMYIMHTQENSPVITTKYYLNKNRLDDIYLRHLYTVYERVLILENNICYAIQCSEMKDEFKQLNKSVINRIEIDYWLKNLLKSSANWNKLGEIESKCYKVIVDNEIKQNQNRVNSRFLDFIADNVEMSAGEYSFIIPFQEQHNSVFIDFIKCLIEKFQPIYCISLKGLVYSVIIKNNLNV